jgi:DNA-binding MarR family transcriptional regulator
MEVSDQKSRIIFKVLYRLRRHMEKWAVENVPAMSSINFSPTYMPYFMNIGYDGISNTDLVDKIKVTKQGVGKIVKELEKLGLVTTEKSETDARSNMIFLSEEGRKFYGAVRGMTRGLTEQYAEVVGVENYEQCIDTLIKLAEWHEQQEKLR